MRCQSKARVQPGLGFPANPTLAGPFSSCRQYGFINNFNVKLFQGLFMSLSARLEQDYITAYKAKDAVRLGVLRLL